MSEVNEDIDESAWDIDPDDEQGAAVLAMVARQLKTWREMARMKVTDFGKAIGYGEDMVRKVEGGTRIPKPEYLDNADRVLKAGGRIAAMKEDVEPIHYPKKVRDLAKLEAKAVEVCAYSIHTVHGLLQTEEHARALFEMRQPAYSHEEIERFTAARMARHSIYVRDPAPTLSFVQEETTLRRRVGGTMVWRRQLEHLLEVAKLRNLSFQIMPIDQEIHAGLDGGIEVLKFANGTGVGRSEGAFGGRAVDELKQLRLLELRYGMIRSQALTPRESTAFIEQVLGET
ncbi:helix-turn-helix transcriptional regulator [Streptomyces sp. NPDC089919]|uniref:helix-turn-helix domain-containing protein n=1 Tax=Streptomyces sp. NPDC089919 TaxID=3155188 RepID=UPI00343BE696